MKFAFIAVGMSMIFAAALVYYTSIRIESGESSPFIFYPLSAGALGGGILGLVLFVYSAIDLDKNRESIRKEFQSLPPKKKKQFWIEIGSIGFIALFLFLWVMF